MIFFYQAYSPRAIEWLNAQCKRSSEYQIKYVSRFRTLAKITVQWKVLKLELVALAEIHISVLSEIISTLNSLNFL